MSHIARTPKQIGEVVRRLRLAAGQTQGELGRSAGLRQGTISKIENGNQASEIETICLVLAALGQEFEIKARSKGSPADIESMF